MSKILPTASLFLFAFLARLDLAAAAAEGAGDFDGNVEVHIKHVPAGEDLVQIIDKTRLVICYGKLSTGGAATISCQKYSEGPSSPKPARPHQ